MELFFLLILVLLMGGALASGFPVAFALPGSAIITILLAAGSGYIFADNPDAYFAQGSAANWLSAGVTNFRGIYWEVERDTLIAIPLFVFMGIMLQRSKIAEDLLITMAQLFGPVRGGLGISVVFVGALLAATTGIVGATVVAMGLISLPAMIRNNYQNWLSTGTIAASGTLGQIIPPSIVLIILADQLSNATDQAASSRTALYKDATGDFSMPSEFAVSSTSAGDMFMGALLPGLVLVAVYMIFILVVAFLKRDVAPPVPREGAFDKAFVIKILVALIPPLTLIFIVLGSIITGIATVNQAGAVGAIGAMIMAGYRLYEGRQGAFWPAAMAALSIAIIIALTSMFDINVRAINTGQDVLAIALASIAVFFFLVAVGWSMWRTLKVENTMQGVLMETAKTTSLVFIILLGAAMLTSAFRAFGGEELVKEFLGSLPGGFWTQFIIVMLVIFILGFFLDFIEIAVVVVPIVAPILLADPTANISAVWLGVMIGLNIQTSFLTPPFGFALFYLRGVAPPVVRTLQMYKGVIPFIALQLSALVIVGFNPQLVNYLPTRMSLLSETAPPPANPRMQACIKEYTEMRFAEDRPMIEAAIARAQGLDLSSLPSGLANDFLTGTEKAAQSFDMLADLRAATRAIEDAADIYAPLQQKVRRLEREIRDVTEQLETAARDLDRATRNDSGNTALIAALTEDVAQYTAEKAAFESEIPAEWEQAFQDFSILLNDEKTKTRDYRRTVDEAYEPVMVLLATIAGSEALVEIRDEVAALEEEIRSTDPAVLQDIFKAMESRVGEIEGASDIRTALTNARRAMRARSSSEPDPAKALEEHAKAMAILDEEIAWRMKASDALLSELRIYDAAIQDTIGLRQLDRMPRDVALYVASCRATHRDISLYF